MNTAFFDALGAERPHPSLGVHADTYGRLIGSWTGETHHHAPDGRVSTGSLEVRFAWVLDGRAVQDVWVTPARPDRGAQRLPRQLDWYGTTVRTFDPKSETWRAVWLDPVMGTRVDLIGRRRGDDIVQIGRWDERVVRWTFSEIQPASYLWQGHILEADGGTWRLQVDCRLTRA